MRTKWTNTWKTLIILSGMLHKCYYYHNYHHQQSFHCSLNQYCSVMAPTGPQKCCWSPSTPLACCLYFPESLSLSVNLPLLLVSLLAEPRLCSCWSPQLLRDASEYILDWLAAVYCRHYLSIITATNSKSWQANQHFQRGAMSPVSWPASISCCYLNLEGKCLLISSAMNVYKKQVK